MTTRSKQFVAVTAIVIVVLAGVYYLTVIPARCKAALERETVGPGLARYAYDKLRSVPFRAHTADRLLARYWDRRGERGETRGDPAESVLARLRALELDATEQRVESATQVTELFADLLSTVSLFGAERRRGELLVAAISRDGKSVITIDRRGRAARWDELPGEARRAPMFAGKITAAAFADDPARVATVSVDGSATVWQRGAALASFRLPSPITCVALSGDGERLAIAAADRTVRVRDVASSRDVGDAVRHESDVTALAFSGSRLWCGCADGTLRGCNTTAGKHEEVLRVPARIRALSGEETKLLAADDEGRVHVIDFRTGALARRRFVAGGDLRSVCLLAGGEVACTGGDGLLRRWRLVAPELATEAIAHSAAVYVADIDRGGRAVITGASDGFARLFELGTGQPKGAPMPHTGGVLAVALSAEGRRAVTGGRDGAVRLWDTETGQPLGRTMKHDDWIVAVAISRDGRWIATGSLDGCARLWDAQKQERVGRRMVHRGWLYALSFSPDGSKLLTGSDDGTARIWDVATQEQHGVTMRHDLGVTSVAFGPRGELAATASLDGYVRLWSVESTEIVGSPLPHPDHVWAVWFAEGGAVLSATRASLHRTPVNASGLVSFESVRVAAAWPLALWGLDHEGTRVAIATLVAGSRVEVRSVDFAAMGSSRVDAGSLERIWGERLGCEIGRNWLLVGR